MTISANWQIRGRPWHGIAWYGSDGDCVLGFCNILRSCGALVVKRLWPCGVINSLNVTCYTLVAVWGAGEYWIVRRIDDSGLARPWYYIPKFYIDRRLGIEESGSLDAILQAWQPKGGGRLLTKLFVDCLSISSCTDGGSFNSFTTGKIVVFSLVGWDMKVSFDWQEGNIVFHRALYESVGLASQYCDSCLVFRIRLKNNVEFVFG